MHRQRHSIAPRALRILLFALTALAVHAEEERSTGPEPAEATFHRHVLPIFRERCIGCHGGERPKSGLRLETHEEVLAGGDDGPAVAPGKPAESLLFRLITGAEKPIMPPREKGSLEREEIAVIRAWIEGGCREGEPVATEEPYGGTLEPPVYRRPPAVTALVWSRDGERLLVAGLREILVHGLREARAPGPLPEARLVGESEQIHALLLSTDDRLLVAAGGNPGRFGEVQIWDLPRRRLRHFARLGRDTLFAAALSPDGQRLAVAGTDRSIHVLEIETGRTLASSELHSDWVFGLCFSADGERIISGSRDRTVKVSAAADGKFLRNLVRLESPIMRIIGRPGIEHFLAAGESRVPVLYDDREMKELRRFDSQPGAILAAAFSADGKLLAVGGAASEIRIYRADDGERAALLKVPEPWVYALAFAPQGERIAVAGYDGKVRVFAVEDGRALVEFLPVPLGRFESF